MKTSNHFNNTIKAYLDKRAAEDPLFAVTYAKEGKNVDDCVTYILNQVQKSGCNGFADEEVYSIAVHYYDEDDIEVGSKINCRAVVNHTVELTEDEKEGARKKAIQRAEDEAYKAFTKKNIRPKKKSHHVEQPSLFD